MASATATAGSQNSKTVMGHPVQVIPPNANVVLGNPQVNSPAEPSPPPVFLHQLFHHSNRRSRYLVRRDKILVYRFSVIAMLLFVAMACIFLMLLLLLRPHLPHLQITSLTVSPLSTINNAVSATCNISIVATNPNQKLTAFYDSFRVSLHYQSEKLLLANVQVPPLSQPAKTDTFLHIHLQINHSNVGKDAIMALKGNLDHGLVGIDVKIFASIRLESKGWSTKAQMVLFHCPDVMLEFSASDGPGDLTDHFKECEVAL